MADVYELLTQELTSTLNLHPTIAKDVVDYLDENGFLDYDTLKEIYLGSDED